MSRKIVILVMDVDGTLTDGKVYVGSSGELFKAFDVKDGLGIAKILPQAGILPVVITGRESAMLQLRCLELGVQQLYQGVSDKVACLAEILAEQGVRWSDVAYIGDDINDLPCMEKVKEAGGIVACPADAAGRILEEANYICSKSGGAGAVREFIEWIVGRR